MPIELRWAVSPYTTHEKPVLQWREIDIPGGCIVRDWTNVPVVVIDPTVNTAHPSAPEGGKP